MASTRTKTPEQADKERRRLFIMPAPPPPPRETPEQRKARNDQLQAENAARLKVRRLKTAEKSFLATCQRIYHRDRGSSTPFEEFFVFLVTRAERDMWPTPDMVASDLEQFRQNWESIKEEIALFRESYPNHGE